MIKKYSLCLTNYNRTEELLRAIEKVEQDPRIAEICISDDASTSYVQDWLKKWMWPRQKVRLEINAGNMGMLRNKLMAVGMAQCEKVILLDSDNQIDTDYLDALDQITMQDNVIYLPEYAKPEFDYRKYTGQTFDRHSSANLIDEPMFNCMLNTCNYAFRRESYLSLWRPNDKMRGTDTMWFAYLWLSAGNLFYVVPGMQYLHTVHQGSGWLQHAAYNTIMAEQLKSQIKELVNGN